jgi:hypothetical protein
MTNIQKYLKNVINPEDITGTSKKYEFNFKASETVHYSKPIEIIATSEADAEIIAEQMCDDSVVCFTDDDIVDSDGFEDFESEYECELE